MKEMSVSKRCLAQFIVALARLETERVPYVEIKKIFKEVLLTLVGSKDGEDLDYGLFKMTLHNLATLNYIEILEFGEKGGSSS